MGQSEWVLPGSTADVDGYVETYADSQWDPKEGWEQELRYRGDPADIVALGNAFIAAGWKARTESTNSQWATLIVSVPNNNAEEFIDRYEFNIDFRQQDLWLNLAIRNYLTATAGLSDSQMLALKSQLETCLEKKQTVAQVAAALGDEQSNIYQMMVMGQEYVDCAQPTLARKRTYDISFAGQIMSTRMTQDVFSTSALISVFDIPGSVAASISADPATTPVVNYAYGWKMRKNNLVILPAKNKIEEQVDFVWDQWSTIAYNYIA